MPSGDSSDRPSTPSEIPAGSELLITSIRTGNTEVFAVDLTFGDMRNLTRNPSSEDRYPIWSPDGSKVVFTSNRDVPQTWNLYVMDADGQNARRLTNVAERGICYFPTWTQDLIYFGYASGDGLEVSIACVRPDGSGFRVLAPGRDPAISPDGQTIAFTQHTGRGYCLFAMNADGTAIRQLTTHENEIGAVTPAWSPDGRKLLYSDQVGKKLELFTLRFRREQSKAAHAAGPIRCFGGLVSRHGAHHLPAHRLRLLELSRLQRVCVSGKESR